MNILSNVFSDIQLPSIPLSGRGLLLLDPTLKSRHTCGEMCSKGVETKAFANGAIFFPRLPTAFTYL